MFGFFDAWKPGETAGTLTDQEAFRASVARGADVFFLRPIWIRDTVHINTIGLGNPLKRTCATCHNSRMVGMDLAPGSLVVSPFIGVNNLFDEAYNSNLRINAFGGRYFEPGPERNVYGGIELRYDFR